MKATPVAQVFGLHPYKCVRYGTTVAPFVTYFTNESPKNFCAAVGSEALLWVSYKEKPILVY
jgi:hypothetical protein